MRVIELTKAAGATSMQYVVFNSPMRITDPRGNTTRYGYDSSDRVISMTDALSKTESYAYTIAGQMTQTID